MREIRFRAWDKEYKKMEYVGQLRFAHPRGTNPGCLEFVCFDKYDTLFDVDKIILMQFTNLHDKNNVPIYEGDIVKHPNNYKEIVKFVNELSGYQPFTFTAIDDGTRPESIEIIGNIYENPELLAKKV